MTYIRKVVENTNPFPLKCGNYKHVRNIEQKRIVKYLFTVNTNLFTV